MWFHLCWTVLPSSEPAFRRHKNWQMSLSFPKDTQSMYASEMENIEFTIVLWGWGTVQAKFRMGALCSSFRYPRRPGQKDASISLCPSCTPQKFCYKNIAIPVRVLFLNYTMAPGHKSTSCALGCLHQNILQSDPVRHDHIRMGSKFQSDIDLVNKKHMPGPEPFAIEVCKTRLWTSGSLNWSTNTEAKTNWKEKLTMTSIKAQASDTLDSNSRFLVDNWETQG
jgi:hypothetical protein